MSFVNFVYLCELLSRLIEKYGAIKFEQGQNQKSQKVREMGLLKAEDPGREKKKTRHWMYKKCYGHKCSFTDPDPDTNRCNGDRPICAHPMFNKTSDVQKMLRQ